MILSFLGLFQAVVSAGILDLWDGDHCSTLDGGQGTCVLLSKCNNVGDFKNNHPRICNFRGKEPIICCPIKQGLGIERGRKVKKICSELDFATAHLWNAAQPIRIQGFEQPSKYGWGAGGVGGTEVPPKEHPYMALIGFCGSEKKYCDDSDVTWGCGGSLITPFYVLSAAHCAHPFGLGPAKWARMGDLDIGSSEDDARPVNKSIIDIIIHPRYQDSQIYHDIALFKLDSKVMFNGYVLPVCLQTERLIEHDKANFTGWGRTGFVEATSEKLLEGEIDIYNDTECGRLMFSKPRPKSPLGHQAQLMLCAGVPDGSKDTCPGDSGGPLVTRGTPQYKHLKIQIGITSFGDECGLPDSPGVYTRVSNYIPWIEEVAFKDVTL